MYQVAVVIVYLIQEAYTIATQTIIDEMLTLGDYNHVSMVLKVTLHIIIYTCCTLRYYYDLQTHKLYYSSQAVK